MFLVLFTLAFYFRLHNHFFPIKPEFTALNLLMFMQFFFANSPAICWCVHKGSESCMTLPRRCLHYIWKLCGKSLGGVWYFNKFQYLFKNIHNAWFKSVMQINAGLMSDDARYKRMWNRSSLVHDENASVTEDNARVKI